MAAVVRLPRDKVWASFGLHSVGWVRRKPQLVVLGGTPTTYPNGCFISSPYMAQVRLRKGF